MMMRLLSLFIVGIIAGCSFTVVEEAQEKLNGSFWVHSNYIESTGDLVYAEFAFVDSIVKVVNSFGADEEHLFRIEGDSIVMYGDKFIFKFVDDETITTMLGNDHVNFRKMKHYECGDSFIIRYVRYIRSQLPENDSLNQELKEIIWSSYFPSPDDEIKELSPKRH